MHLVKEQIHNQLHYQMKERINIQYYWPVNIRTRKHVRNQVWEQNDTQIWIQVYDKINEQT